MRRLVPILWLAACGGPLEETLLDELRVLAAPVDPPEVLPGEDFAVTPLVVDPRGDGFELLAWMCTPTGPPGSPCAELAVGGVDVVIAQGEEPIGLRAAAELGPAIPESGLIVSEIRILACVVGSCPLFDEVRGGADPTDEGLAHRLSSVDELLRGVPLDGVAFSRRPLRVLGSAVGRRGINPTLTVVAPETAAVGASVTVEVTAEDLLPSGAAAWGYATAGGFDAPFAELVDGAGTLTWIAPEELPPADVQLFVVLSDEFGGEAVWTGRIAVQ